MAAKFFTGLPLDGPDPECVLGHGEARPRRPGRPSVPPSPRPTTRSAARAGSWHRGAATPPAPERVPVTLLPVPAGAPTRDRPPRRSPRPDLRRAPPGRLRPRPRPRRPVTALADPVTVGRPHGAVPGGVRPPRDQPRPGRALERPTRRLLRRRAPPGAPGSSSPRRPRCTRRTGPTSGRRWPSACGPGWRAVAEACRPHGTLVLAGLGHAGGQGSSAYSQSVLWAPSPVADVVSREMPMAMGRPEIDALVEGFAGGRRPAAAGGARRGGARRRARCRSCGSSTPGSPTSATTPTARTACRLTRRGPRRRPGRRRARPDRRPAPVVRRAGPVGRRHPRARRRPGGTRWPGCVDLLVVVRGGPYSATAYRPDAHTPAGFNLELCAAMRRAAAGGSRRGAPGERGRPAMAAVGRWPTARPTWSR